MRLEKVDGPAGTVTTGGVTSEVRLDLLDAPRVGDYVLVHAGYAIAVLDEQEARETLGFLQELLGGDAPGGEPG